MKKAIIIPVYLRLKTPDELLHLEGVQLTMRAIESLGILEDQNFTLILPVCFDLTDGYRVCQSYLGAKIHDAKDPGSDLGPMFTQVVSSVYGMMGNYQPVWKEIRISQPVPTFGFHYEVGLEPVSVNIERMVGNFRLGVKDLMGIWGKALSQETAHRLESIGRLSDKAFLFPQDLWVRIIYDFAITYHQGSFYRDHLLKSMIPLYLGRVASFVKENLGSSASEVEEGIESLCMVFEKMKPYLTERWEQ